MKISKIVALIPVAALAVACGGGEATPEAKAPEGGEAAAAPEAPAADAPAADAPAADAAKPEGDAAAKPEEKKEEAK